MVLSIDPVIRTCNFYIYEVWLKIASIVPKTCIMSFFYSTLSIDEPIRLNGRGVGPVCLDWYLEDGGSDALPFHPPDIGPMMVHSYYDGS